MLHEYLWCVIVGAIFCFTLGFGMGANDVANNFGTSVGSKSISLRKALVIAAIFELIGSVGLGASVTDSLRTGVYRPDAFGDMPDFILVANLAALVTVTGWLIAASLTGMTVSTTHSLVGAMLGCGLAIGGHSINWPYIGTLFLSWLVAPLSSLVLGSFYFAVIRSTILRSHDPVKRGLRVLWLLLFALCCTCTFFFVYKNPLTFSGVTCRVKKNGEFIDQTPCSMKDWTKTNTWTAFGVALGSSAGMTLIGAPFLYKWAKGKVRDWEKRQAEQEEGAVLESGQSPTAEGETGAEQGHGKGGDGPESEEGKRGVGNRLYRAWKAAPWNQDLHAEVYEEKPKANELALLAEKFDERCEAFFGALQTMSAAVACLVHGSNDVANAAAPFASVYSIYTEGQFLKSVSVPIWILILGGGAISVGLMLLGHRVIKRVGIELFYISASRGFCVEMALSTIVLIASFLGQSVSTTHVGVGAMLGIGMMDNHFDPVTGQNITKRKLFFFNTAAINWGLTLKFATAWILTIIICGFVGCAIFAFSIFTPTKVPRFSTCLETGQCSAPVAA